MLQKATEELSHARNDVISTDVPAFWNTTHDNDTATFNVISETDATYLSKVGNVSGIQTVRLTVNRKQLSSVIYRQYYDVTSNECQRLFISSKSTGFTCIDNSRHAFLNTHPALPQVLSKGLPPHVLNSQHGNNDVILLTYIHIMSQSFVSRNGDVYVNSTKIVTQRCFSRQGMSRKSLTVHSVLSSPLHDEVFTISQYWGQGFFHSTLESLPRLAPYLPYLRLHPHIKIHAYKAKHPFFPLLGLDPQRVVTGDVRARTLYMPAGGPCGNPPLFSTQVLALYLREKPDLNDDRNNIILIKRSHRRRWFAHHDSILKRMETLARPFGFNVTVYADDPVPGVNVTKDMFARAFLVVAPHGAGESNLVFSRPGTVLVEGLCYSRGKVNLCYKSMADSLGLRYYGVVFNKTCIDITADDLDKPLRETLTMKIQGLL